jgi:hypothetical protein
VRAVREAGMASDRFWHQMKYVANVVGVLMTLGTFALFGYYANLVLRILRYH